MEVLDFLMNGRLLLAMAAFGLLAALEPFIENWVRRVFADNSSALWSWEALGVPLLRALLVISFVFAAYPALFGLREAPSLGILISAADARPSAVLGLLFLLALFAPVLPLLSSWPALLLPLQGILATAFLFKWMTSYLAISTSSLWPGTDLALAIVGMSFLAQRAGRRVGHRLGESIDELTTRDGYDGLLMHVISRQVQLPVIVIYAVGLARQIAI